MISWESALQKIKSNAKVCSNIELELEQSLGYKLAKDLFATLDIPPFNKSAVDGYALRASDYNLKDTLLSCVGVVEAGKNFDREISPGECVKIMTGACIVRNADSVVMIEDTESFPNKKVKIKKIVKKGQNICFQGEDVKKKQKVASRGHRISVLDIALLASVGIKIVKVINKPKVAVLNTGGEIVPLGNKINTKLTYKIYNSNGPQLMALLKQSRIKAQFLGIAKDRVDDLEKKISLGLKSNILLISGGVSMGDYDLVPQVLERLGVEKIFHNVCMKPGKPLFFGRKKDTLIFGIPGNPISNFLVYTLFVRLAILKMSGEEDINLNFEQAVLTKNYFQKPGRTHFVLVKAKYKNSRFFVTPVRSNGSADVAALADTQGCVMIHKDVTQLKAGAQVRFLSFKGLF